MYRISETFDISVLKNEVLHQIAFGVNFITLFFDNGFIQITGGFVFDYHGTQICYDEVYPVESDFGLLKILENRVIDVSIDNMRDKLKIIFENEVALCLIGNEAYESFTINFNGDVIRV